MNLFKQIFLSFIYLGNSTVAESLIRNGTDVNANTYEGATALMFAAMNGNFKN